ncbi:DUF4184 family protein [Streptomyces sp. NPDC004610]|uniref:DUF4184 family protein n=1 Tax=unclassified Streptomyces TaxID=2593676 RepID=UPI0033B81AE3
MPFTLSHAAAVLPLIRTDGTGRGRLVPAALIAGTFAPDMTYYAASVLSDAMEYGEVTHSLPGVLTVDVAVAWALVGLWLVVREPLVALLPPDRQHRVAALLRCGAPRARVRFSTVWWWYVSAALGALTHVVWDAFTHLDRWGMRVFPVLGEEIAGSPLYWYLQYGGSAVAALVIAVFVGRGLRRVPGRGCAAGEGPVGSPPSGVPAGVPVLSGRDRVLALLVIAGIAVLAAVERAVSWWGRRSAVAEPWELIPTVCFGGGAGLLVGVVWYGVTVRVRRYARAGGGGDGSGGKGAWERAGSR